VTAMWTQADFAVFQVCFTGPDGQILNSPCRCDCYDRDGNEHVDAGDFAAWKDCASGPGIPADPACDD